MTTTELDENKARTADMSILEVMPI